MLKILIADTKSAPIVSELGKKTFTEAFGYLFSDKNDLIDYLEKTFSISKIKSSLSKEGNIYWLGFWNGIPVAYAKLKLNSPSPFIDSKNVCQLQKIYVLKAFTSKRIGHEIQQALLKTAAEKNFDFIWLSVWASNNGAIRFYNKNKFKKTGNHDFTIGQETFKFQVMTLNLKSVAGSMN